MAESPGGFRAWLVIYDKAYRRPSSLASQACPNCGRTSLRLVFVSAEWASAVLVHLWCDACLHGMMPLQAPSPQRWETVDINEVSLPRFAIVPPRTAEDADIPVEYDGEWIRYQLERMPTLNYQAFVAACAEALVADFGAAVPGHALTRAALQGAADDCWAAVEGTGAGRGGLEARTVTLEEAASSDGAVSGDEYEGSGVGKYVVDGLRYALRCLRDDDPGLGESVSRSLYDAAYHSALGDPSWTADGETSADEHPLVGAVMEKIGEVMHLVGGWAGERGGPVDVALVRQVVTNRVPD